MTIFIRNTLTASVLLATVSLYGCGSGSVSGSSPGSDPQSTPDTANSTQTTPEMAVTVQKNYQNPDGSFNQQKFQQAQQAYIANGSQYQATDTQVFNPTISYSQPGTFVRYSEQQADGRYLVGDFRNKWFADAGTTPQFFPGNSPWELTGIALQVTSDLSTPESLSAELAGQAVVLPWRSEAAYPGGYSVKLNDVCYRNKWWTQGDMPPASEPGIAWSTPWKWLGSQPELVITDHCQGNIGSRGVTDGSDSPDGTGSETDTGNTPVANNGDQNPTPEIPPVIPEDNSDSSDTVGDAVATPAPLELPESGYEFLRQVSSQDWDWLFPLRSGK